MSDDQALEHAEWIDANVDGDGYGTCCSITEKMVGAFPGLRRAAGFYHDPIWGKRQHWWCVAPCGAIVDPTAGQFPSQGMGRYEELNLDDPEDLERIPSGVCMECGGEVFQGDTFCSTGCEAAGMAYLGLARQPDGSWRNR